MNQRHNSLFIGIKSGLLVKKHNTKMFLTLIWFYSIIFFFLKLIKSQLKSATRPCFVLHLVQCEIWAHMRSNCCANIRIYLFLVFSSCSFHPFVVLISTWLQWSSISWFMTGSIQITEIRAWHVVVAFLWTCLSINMREKKTL